MFLVRNIYGISLTWKAARGTKVVWLTVVVTLTQLSIIYLPPLQVVLGTQTVPFLNGLLIIGIGIMPFIIVEVEKQMRLRLQTM